MTERAKRREGTFPSLRGHRLRKKAAGLEKDEERAPDLVLRGRRRMGEGGEQEERKEGRVALAVSRREDEGR